MGLFTNPEAGENPAEQIVGGEITGALAKCLLRQTQLIRQQLTRPCPQQPACTLPQGSGC